MGEVKLNPKPVDVQKYQAQHPDDFRVLQALNPLEQATLYVVGKKLKYSKSMHLDMKALITSAVTNKRKDVEHTILGLAKKGMLYKYGGHSYALSDQGLSIVTGIKLLGWENKLDMVYTEAYRKGEKAQAES